MKKIGILVAFVFLLGWFSSFAYSQGNENILAVNPREIMSPFNIISEDKIAVYKDRIVIYVDNPILSKYADTNSMDPVLDNGANGLQIIPDSIEDIHVGDIISYEPEWSDKIIVHRVIYIGEDDEGWYAIAKGDNSNVIDPGKIRFNKIRYLLIGVIY